MDKITLAGIRRGNQFSPNHIGNDAAIFSLTAEHLRKLGCEVNEYIESDLLLNDAPKEKGIFNMVRDWKSIHKLLHSVYIRFHISNNLERVAGIQTSRPGHLFRSYMAAQINPYSSHTDFYTTPARLRSSPPSERRNLR